MKIKSVKLFLILSIVFFNITSVNSQIFSKEKKTRIFETGFASGFLRAVNKDRITFDKSYITFCRIEPFIGYFPLKNKGFSVGIRGEFQGFKTNIDSFAAIQNFLYGVGIYSRYIFPYKLKYRFFKNINFFSEININKKNYKIDYIMPQYTAEGFTFNYPESNNKLKYYNINIPVGLIIKIKNNFKFEFAEQYSVYIGGKSFFDPKISFSYIYKEKTKEEKIAEQKRKTEKKYQTKERAANNNFLNGFTAGTSLTYIWNSNIVDYPAGENFYEEYTWNLNFATTLNKQFTAGIQVLSLFTSGTHVEKSNYFIYGIFSQFDFIPQKKTSMFAEMSVNRGDYCTCGHLDPYRQKNLWYYGFGGGFEFPLRRITDKLYLDLSFVNYIILNKIKTKYNYTQYIVGLNYHIGKERK